MIIAANVKMNFALQHATEYMQNAQAVLPSRLHGHEVIFFIPHCYLHLAPAPMPTGGFVAFGAQDCHHESSGAFTGDVSADMISSFGVQWTLAGHSERRLYHHETDMLVAAKAIAAQKAGLNVMICVGEHLEDRNQNRHLDVVHAQINTIFNAILESENAAATRVAVAYEPVWAIGTGKSAQSDQIEEMHVSIRQNLADVSVQFADVPVLYGGSVKPENADEIASLSAVDGALVGGASLNLNSFAQICLNSCQK